MFNRTYHIRARKAAIGKLVAEGLLDRDGFYRPSRPVSPVPGPKPQVAPGNALHGPPRGQRKAFPGGRQLELPFPLTEEELAAEFDRLFPEEHSR